MKGVRRFLVNHFRGLDVFLFYVLLLILLGVVVYLFAPVGMRRAFNRYAPPIVAFCLMVQTLLGLEPPNVVRPLLRYLVRPRDEVIYRWNDNEHFVVRNLEIRFGQVRAVERGEVPENYRGAFRNTARVDLAVIETGALEVKVPLEFVMLR